MASELSSYLKETYLDDANRITWGALASSIIGGLILKFWDGFRGTAVALGKSAEAFTSPIITQIETETQNTVSIINEQVSQTFTAIDVGAISGPVNVIIAVIAFTVLALLINYLLSFWRDF